MDGRYIVTASKKSVHGLFFYKNPGLNFYIFYMWICGFKYICWDYLVFEVAGPGVCWSVLPVG